MLRFVPPAGTPFKLSRLSRLLKPLVSPVSPNDCLESFAACVRVRFALGVSSGRAALTIILRALRRLRPDRDGVALPAYTCFSVPASIVRAGLKLAPIEIDQETLDFDFLQLEKVLSHRPLCIVVSNLFGLVNDVHRIREKARLNNVYVVDDAAQSFGALRYGQFSGTLGDVGFYSLGRGKPLPGEGGIIVTDSPEIAAAVREESDRLPRSSRKRDITLLSMLMAASILFSPGLYWIPNSLTFLKLGTTEFEPSFPIMNIAHISCALLQMELSNILEMTYTRVRNASKLAHALAENPAFRIPKVEQDCRPNYVRFPVVASCEAVRNTAVQELHRASIGASPFYPSAICDIEGIASHIEGDRVHHPKAEDLSRRLLTLPTHPLVTKQDLETMIGVLQQVADLQLKTSDRELESSVRNRVLSCTRS